MESHGILTGHKCTNPVLLSFYIVISWNIPLFKVWSKDKLNKTFNKRKNRALLTLRRSQKHHEIFSNNVLRKNITRKQLRLETIEIV